MLRFLARADQVLGEQAPVGAGRPHILLRGARANRGDDDRDRIGILFPSRRGVPAGLEDEPEHVRPTLEVAEVALVLGQEADLELVAHAPESASEYFGLLRTVTPLPVVFDRAEVRSRALPRVDVEALCILEERLAGDAAVGNALGRGQLGRAQVLPGNLAFDQESWARRARSRSATGSRWCGRTATPPRAGVRELTPRLLMSRGSDWYCNASLLRGETCQVIWSE